MNKLEFLMHIAKTSRKANVNLRYLHILASVTKHEGEDGCAFSQITDATGELHIPPAITSMVKDGYMTIEKREHTPDGKMIPTNYVRSTAKGRQLLLTIIS